MAGVTGRDAKMAFGVLGLNSWGVAASVTKGVYFTTTGGLRLQPARVNDETFGQAFLGSGDLGDVTAPNLTYVGRSRYNDNNYILDAQAMGSPNAVTISTSVAGQVTSWLHVIDLATSTDGRGITTAVDKSRYVDELTSAKVYGMMEQVGTDGVIDRSYKVLGTKPTNISSTNITATVTGALYPSLSNRIYRKHGTFRMNAQGGSSLSSGDAVAIETFDFTFERPQDAPFVYGQDFIYAPADDGFPTTQFKVKYPRMTQTSADSLYAALRTETTVFKADMTYAGAFINSTDQFTRKYQFPHVELLEWNGADVDGAKQVKPEATFICKLAATSPSGMAFVNPFRLTLIQQNSTVAP